MITTNHIRGMIQASLDLAFCAQYGHWPEKDCYVDDAIKEVAEQLGPHEALGYASALAEHAAAELKMEQFQAKGWPQV